MSDRDVKLIGAAGKARLQGDDVTVCSMDSLHKCDPSSTRLVLIDEPHAAVTDSRLPKLAEFTLARKLGYGATLKGRFDNRHTLIEALIGPVLAERTFKEAVAEGAVCPLVVFMLKVSLTQYTSNRDQAYKALLFRNSSMASLVAKIAKKLLPEDHQVILFIKNEKQAEFYLDFLGQEGTIAMAKRLSTKERTALMEQMRTGLVKRCLASDIYAQGVTCY